MQRVLHSLLVAIAVATWAAPTKPSKQPHLVFVLIDDMGFNDFYSSSDLSAAWPHVASMAAKDCVNLDQYYTQPICTPSRGAFITGRMPLRLGLQHGVINGAQDYGLPLDEVTLPDKLRSVGYRTYGVGKWHLGMYNNASTPTKRGFDHFYGYWNGYEDYWSHTVALGAGPSVEPVQNGYLDLHDDEALVRGKEGTYGPELFSQKALEFIADHKAHHADSPMFLYYPMQNVHDPLEAMDEDLNSTACKNVPNAERKLFCGMARSADRAIANLTAALTEAFGGDDVLVMISGDNGGNVNSAGNNCPDINKFCLRGHKATLWEGGIRNRALVCSKTMLPADKLGTTYSKGMVHLMDMHATLEELGLAGHPTTGPPLDGKSIWSAITKDTPSPRTEFVVNIDPCSGHGSCNGVEAGIRSGDWKFMSGVNSETWYPVPSASRGTAASLTQASVETGDTWLFNVTHDPGETINLSDKYPDVVKSLKAKLAAASKEALAPCNVPNGTCNAENMAGWAAIKAADGWVPWIGTGRA